MKRFIKITAIILISVITLITHPFYVKAQDLNNDITPMLNGAQLSSFLTQKSVSGTNIGISTYDQTVRGGSNKISLAAQSENIIGSDIAYRNSVYSTITVADVQPGTYIWMVPVNVSYYFNFKNVYLHWGENHPTVFAYGVINGYIWVAFETTNYNMSSSSLNCSIQINCIPSSTVQTIKRWGNSVVYQLNSSNNTDSANVQKTLLLLEYFKENSISYGSGNSGSVSVDLFDIESYLQSINSNVSNLFSLGESIEEIAESLDSYLLSIDSKLSTTNIKLQTIIDLLNGNNNSNTDELDNTTEELTDLITQENELSSDFNDKFNDFFDSFDLSDFDFFSGISDTNSYFKEKLDYIYEEEPGFKALWVIPLILLLFTKILGA